MKRKQRLWMKQFLCWLLCISMIAPSTAPIVAEAATGLSNLPRYAEFVRPEALTLKELGLETATASQATPAAAQTFVSSTVTTMTTATPSELRRPQDFYEIPDDEPGGVLVQFDAERNIRTYMQSEGEYITIVGGYSGLYEDEASNIRLIDNDLVSALDHQKPSDPDDEDEEESEDNSEDMDLINDLGLSSGIDEIAVTASPSNTKRLKSVQTATASNAYYNAAGKLSVYIPGQMDGRNGYELSNGEDSIEVIPQGGTYTRHMVRDNAIRYSNVYENVDVQYTVLGDTVKEDIILLDRTGVNSFSYKLKSSSLKFRRDGDAVIAYKNSVKEPVFALTAPVMIDAAGNTSTAISLKYDSSKKIVTYTADEDWLNAEEREYPVRIDPTGATLVDYTAFQLNMVAKVDYERNVGDSTEEVPVLQPHAYNTYFGSNVNPMAGYSEEYGYCRALIHIDTAWEALMDHEATKTEGPGIKNVELKLNTMTHDAVDRTGFAAFIAGNSWDPGTVTWAKMKAAGVDENMVQAGEIQYSNGSGEEMTFDITDIYYKWVSGEAPRNGLVIQAYAEAGDTVYHPGDEDKSPVSWAETFYNQNGGSQFGPCLRVVWEGKLQNRNLEILDMSEFSVDVGAGVVETEAGGRDVKGVLAHGISQADSTIEYRLHNKNGDIEVTGSTAAGLSAECPDYQEVHDDCLWAKYQDSNWQSDPAFTLDPLELNKIYYFTARGTGKEIVENEEGELEQGTEEVTTDWKKTDEFLLYLVQASDILPRIARYYGVSTNTLRDDNQFGYQLAEAGEAILIRNPATEEPYTAPLSNDQLEEFIRNCLLNGHDPRCVLGGEPVNLSTGSFYMTQEDAAFDDLDGSFAITRSYNGLTPYFRSEFGMGWNSSIGERIMVLQDGSILFTREDGKGLVFTKTGEDSFEAPDGYDYELRPVDAIDLVMGSDTEEEGTQADSETDSGEEAAAVSLFSLEEETEPEGDASDEETGEEESGIEPVEPSTGWEITEPDGTVRVFNAYGLLVSKKNRKEHAVSYVYDEDYLLTEIIAPSGKSYEVTMEADGKIMEIGLPDGTSVVYEYDEEDNLVSVTDPEGGIKRFEYDENHRMTAWYDENGTKVIENILDEEGRVTEQTDALGNVMDFTYGSDRTELTDNRGNATVYHLDSLR